MRSTVIGLTTVVFALLVCSTTQAALPDGSSVSWQLHASNSAGHVSSAAGTGVNPVNAGVGVMGASASSYASMSESGAAGREFSLSVSVSESHDTDFRGNAVSRIDQVFHIDAPTPFSYSLHWGGGDWYAGGPSFSVTVLNENLGGLGPYSPESFSRTGILQPGTYSTCLFVGAGGGWNCGAIWGTCNLNLTLLPEPATLGLFVLGAAGLIRRR